jgi:hypothetical protein
MKHALALLAIMAGATPAFAADTPETDDLCVDRPGLGAPACVLPQGQVVVELGLAEWAHNRDPDSIADEFGFGDVLLRYGVGHATELGVELATYQTIRIRDRVTGAIEREIGVGDVTLSLQHNLAGGDGPVAVQAFVTLPSGSKQVSVATWQAGAALPVNLTLRGGFELGLTPQVQAAANPSGKGRHLAWGGVIGLGYAIGRDLSLEGEVAAWRDQDPTGHVTDARAALSLAWRVAPDWQLDGEVQFGLTDEAPRHALLMGLARRFR